MPSQQEIERIVEEFDAKFFIGGTNALGEEKPLLFPAKVEVRDWLRTTLTSLTEAHKVEMEKAREEERVKCWEIAVSHIDETVDETLQTERKRLKKLAVLFNPLKFPELANQAYIPVEALTINIEVK